MSTFAALFCTTFLLVLFISIFTQIDSLTTANIQATIASASNIGILNLQQRLNQLPKQPKLNILLEPQNFGIPGYDIAPLTLKVRLNDYQTRDKAVTSLIKDGVNRRDYLLALDKAVGKCNDAVVDILVSKNFDLNSKSKSLIDEPKRGKTVRDDVYDVIDCALVKNTKCEDLLNAARTGDIDKFDVSGSYFQKCKLMDVYTPLDNLVAMG